MALVGFTDSKRLHDVMYPEGMMFALQLPWLLMFLGARLKDRGTRRSVLALAAAALADALIADHLEVAERTGVTSDST